MPVRRGLVQCHAGVGRDRGLPLPPVPANLTLSYLDSAERQPSAAPPTAQPPAKPPHRRARRRSNYDAWVVSLWSLFSCFCHHPSDLSDYFETLLPTLVKAMEDERYPQLLVSTASVGNAAWIL